MTAIRNIMQLVRDPEVASALYDIACEECGAQPSARDAFIGYACDSLNTRLEWRFCGSLGFGGKLYVANGEAWIACYPEDANAERERAIRTANERIKALLLERSAA